MFKSMIMFAALCSAHTAFAGELDEQVANQGLQGTVVIRVDNRNNSAAIATSDSRTANVEAAKALASNADFKTLPASKIKGELDREAGASSWYWCYTPYNYSYNYFYWYGYTYTPYYNYNYSYYSYYYYNRWGFGW